MSSLFWKGMLAFLVVILVAVGTVAVLTGRVTESAFRQYTLTRSGMWEELTTPLAEHYREGGSWVGIQDVLAEVRERSPRWRGGDGAPPGGPPRLIDFRIVDAQGMVVGDTRGPALGAVSQGDLDNGVSIEVDGEVVGYLLPALRNPPDWPLDAAQSAFLLSLIHI